ncbi:NDUF3 factor, partial [Eudromia elegans]|nr:NDUF3 factor [Eudromia elegans]
TRSAPSPQVGSYRDISHESLSLFRLLEPRIGTRGGRSWAPLPLGTTADPTARPLAEILVLGTGDRVERLHPALLRHMRAGGIAVEVQDTANACATFNFLMSEKRLTAAALIPP